MNSLPKASQMGSVLLVIAVVGALLSVAGTPLRPANLTCVNNAAALSIAVAQYAQDNDLHYPPMGSLPAFQAAVLPFARVHSVYVCPLTGADYKPNAALSGASKISRGSDPESVEVFRDGQPHADGLPTVAYADGHLERGGVNQSDLAQSGLNGARTVAAAILQYAQDNDETLPPMRTQAEMQASLSSYLPAHSFRSPETGLLYAPNPSVSGQSLAFFSQPSAIELLRDPRRARDGKYIVVYLDGHAVRQ